MIENIISERMVVDFSSKLPYPLNSKNTHFTLYGRNALYYGVLGIAQTTTRRTILVPAYSCGDEIAPIIKAGFSIRTYEVIAHNLQVSVDDINKAMTRNVAGVLLTHYFGFPQIDLFKIRKICDNWGAFLIEDCAHTVGGFHKNVSLGTVGDISIYSLRKLLPVPHGGVLVVNNPKIKIQKFVTPPSRAVIVDLLIFIGYKLGIFKTGQRISKVYKKLGLKEETQHGARLLQFGGYSLGMSRVSKLFLKLIAPNNILNTRRENFLFYLKYFRQFKRHGKNIRPFYTSLKERVIPLYFPVVVTDSELLYSLLAKKNIFFAPPFWSDLHEYVYWNKYPKIAGLKKRILVLPVDRQISPHNLTQLVESVSYNEYN